MPPSSTAPLRDPASSRTAECASSCQGDASWARAAGANSESKMVAATPSVARAGTTAFMRRLYLLSDAQTSELLVMAHCSSRGKGLVKGQGQGIGRHA